MRKSSRETKEKGQERKRRENLEAQRPMSKGSTEEMERRK